MKDKIVKVLFISLVIATSLCFLGFEKTYVQINEVKINEVNKVEVKVEENKNERLFQSETFLDKYPYRYSNRYLDRYSDRVPQIIGCGARNIPCGNFTHVINNPIEISERNIAPMNVLDPYAAGVPFQVGVLYKINGSLNDIIPLYGVRRFRNSDSWDYTTKVGKQGNFVYLKVVTKRVNNNELQTNDTVIIDGNSGKFRVSMYETSF